MLTKLLRHRGHPRLTVAVPGLLCVPNLQSSSLQMRVSLARCCENCSICCRHAGNKAFARPPHTLGMATGGHARAPAGGPGHATRGLVRQGGDDVLAARHPRGQNRRHRRRHRRVVRGDWCACWCWQYGRMVILKGQINDLRPIFAPAAAGGAAADSRTCCHQAVQALTLCAACNCAVACA